MTYHAPRLTTYGKVRDLTQASKPAGTNDNGGTIFKTKS
jgi:hypothetical protein